jgi:hypothetical protein
LSFSETILRDEKGFVTILTLSEKILKKFGGKTKEVVRLAPEHFVDASQCLSSAVMLRNENPLRHIPHKFPVSPDR